MTAIGEFSQALTQHQLRALRAFYSPRLGRFTAPSTTAFFQVLTRLDPDVLDRAARTWAAQQTSGTDPVAIDGKSIRGAARHNPGAKHLLVAAAEHRSGIVLGQGPELAATFARVQIQIGDSILTRAFDHGANPVRDFLRVPLYPLAEWLASNWWTLIHESENPASRGHHGFHGQHCLGRNVRATRSPVSSWCHGAPAPGS